MQYLADPEMEASFYSWQNLQLHLETANKDSVEQFRRLCSEMLRRKEEYRALARDESRFLSAMAEFEAQIGEDGLKFDGFDIHALTPIPSVAKQADDALSKVLDLRDMPLADRIADHRSQAVAHLAAGRYVDCITNLRLTLKYTLEGVAKCVATQRKEKLPSQKEADIRGYLRDTGFFTEEEWRGFWGIYGLLSVGPHGDADKHSALLAYAACTMSCHYAVEKLQRTLGGGRNT